LGGVDYWIGDLPAAQVIYDELVDAARTSGDDNRVAHALYNAAFTRMVDSSNIEEGFVLLSEAVGLFRKAGDEAGLARCQWAIASAMHFEKRYAEATAALDEAIPLFRKIGDRFSLGWALHTRTVIAVRQQQAGPAQDFVCEGLQIFKEIGDVSGMALLLDDAASAALLAGDRDRAFRLAGASTAHQRTLGAGLGTIVGQQEGRDWEKDIAGDADRGAWSAGMAMGLEQAIDYALVTAPSVELGQA
jgi:tetratricopeptide (TPR) repeat protein